MMPCRVAAPPWPPSLPLLESFPKQTFLVGRSRPGKDIWMKDETRARDDAASRGSSIIPIAADAAAAKLVPGTEVYAALDLGTNNCRLLIACPTQDGFRVIDSFSRIVRLGEGISLNGRMSDAAMTRALAAVSVCRDKIRSKRAARLRLIATEACRAAANGSEFCARVRDELGIAL